jgi:hypothetical protein
MYDEYVYVKKFVTWEKVSQWTANKTFQRLGWNGLSLQQKPCYFLKCT